MGIGISEGEEEEEDEGSRAKRSKQASKLPLFFSYSHIPLLPAAVKHKISSPNAVPTKALWLDFPLVYGYIFLENIVQNSAKIWFIHYSSIFNKNYLDPLHGFIGVVSQSSKSGENQVKSGKMCLF